MHFFMNVLFWGNGMILMMWVLCMCVCVCVCILLEWKDLKKKKKKEEEKKKVAQSKATTTEPKKREKKVYDLPGQKRDPPEEVWYSSFFCQWW